MTDKGNYWTQQRSDGKWESKRGGADRASKVTGTQAEAWAYSTEKAKEAKRSSKAATEKSANATPTAKTRIRQRGKI